MRPCFRFAAADTESPVLSIFDEIGFWGVQAKDFIDGLRAIKAKALSVEINSPGGDVFAGLAMYNALKSSGKDITVKVMGVAASAASLVAMAGDKIVMPKNTFMMVHNPWGVVVGNADELRETADTLDKIGIGLRDTYVAKTGQKPEKIDELLAKDTWLTADEAKELGFATEVVDEIKAKASFDMARADLPENVRKVYAQANDAPPAPAPEPAPAPAPEPAPAPAPAPAEDGAVADQAQALAVTAGLDAPIAASIALAATSLEDAQARIATAREICALCKVAGKPEHAAPAIAANKSVTDVRASLLKAKAEGDEHTDGTRKSDAPAAMSGVSPKKIWDSHNAQTKSRKKGAK